MTGKATDWLDEADDWGDDNGNQGKLISLKEARTTLLSLYLSPSLAYTRTFTFVSLFLSHTQKHTHSP